MGEIKNIENQTELIQAVKANDQLVLKKLYTDNFRKIELYILKNNGSMPQAKDIYQEAFLAVWRNIKAGKFHPQNETAVQGYLYQIAKNKWTDHLRSPQYKKTGPLRENIYSEEAPLANGHELGENDEKIQAIMKAFNKLEAECKELLTHFYFNKKSLREIAVEINLAEASARNKKYRCIKKLREIIQSPNPH